MSRTAGSMSRGTATSINNRSRPFRVAMAVRTSLGPRTKPPAPVPLMTTSASVNVIDN